MPFLLRPEDPSEEALWQRRWVDIRKVYRMLALGAYATAYNEASRLDEVVKASISSDIWVALWTEAHR